MARTVASAETVDLSKANGLRYGSDQPSEKRRLATPGAFIQYVTNRGAVYCALKATRGSSRSARLIKGGGSLFPSPRLYSDCAGAISLTVPLEDLHFSISHFL